MSKTDQLRTGARKYEVNSTLCNFKVTKVKCRVQGHSPRSRSKSRSGPLKVTNTPNQSLGGFFFTRNTAFCTTFCCQGQGHSRVQGHHDIAKSPQQVNGSYGNPRSLICLLLTRRAHDLVFSQI